MCRSQQLGYLTTLAENIAYYVVSGGVNFAAILIATALFPIFYTAGIVIKVADLKGRDNRLAGPGKPDIQYPRFLPLGGKSQVCILQYRVIRLIIRSNCTPGCSIDFLAHTIAILSSQVCLRCS